MKLQKIIFVLAIILLHQTAQAQKTYYPFVYQDNWGLTDSLNNDLVKPEYDYYRMSKNKRFYVFHHKFSSDLPVLSLDTRTGLINKKYKRIYLDDLIIDDQIYNYMDDDKKSFLQNSETDEIVKTQEKIYSIDNLGSQYIIAKYFPSDNELPKSKSPGNDKNGNPLPPKFKSFWRDYYAIYANQLPLKALLKIDADVYIPLYASNEIDGEYMKNIKKYNSNNFEYLLFKKQNELHLYDKDLKLIKKIAYPNGKKDKEIDKDFAVTEVSKVLGKKVYAYFLIYPNMANPGNNNSEKKRDKFEVKKSVEGFYQIIRTENEKVCFTTFFEASFDRWDNSVNIKDKDKLSSSFSINIETGMPYLPEKYVDLLQIKRLP